MLGYIITEYLAEANLTILSLDTCFTSMNCGQSELPQFGSHMVAGETD